MSAAAPLPTSDGPLVLFQGDSITDGGRDARVDSNSSSALGFGYPLLVAAALLESQTAAGFRFLNRAVSGNRSGDLLNRWERDALSSDAAILSVLIGVNDYAHRRAGFYQGTTDDFHSNYSTILSQARKALPTARLVVVEPFLIRSGKVTASWVSEFGEYRQAALRAAQSAGAVFVELQAAFDALAQRSVPGYWSTDGIHPTLAGHSVIADRWRAAVAP